MSREGNIASRSTRIDSPPPSLLPRRLSPIHPDIRRISRNEIFQLARSAGWRFARDRLIRNYVNRSYLCCWLINRRYKSSGKRSKVRTAAAASAASRRSNKARPSPRIEEATYTYVGILLFGQKQTTAAVAAAIVVCLIYFELPGVRDEQPAPSSQRAWLIYVIARHFFFGVGSAAAVWFRAIVSARYAASPSKACVYILYTYNTTELRGIVNRERENERKNVYSAGVRKGKTKCRRGGNRNAVRVGRSGRGGVKKG